jgi:hypothetical protein
MMLLGKEQFTASETIEAEGKTSQRLLLIGWNGVVRGLDQKSGEVARQDIKE